MLALPPAAVPGSLECPCQRPFSPPSPSPSPCLDLSPLARASLEEMSPKGNVEAAFWGRLHKKRPREALPVGAGCVGVGGGGRGVVN